MVMDGWTMAHGLSHGYIFILYTCILRTPYTVMPTGNGVAVNLNLDKKKKKKKTK